MKQPGFSKTTRGAARRALLLLLAVSPAAGLAACGSGGGTSASTAASSVASAPAGTAARTTTTTSTATAAQPPAKASQREAPPPAAASGGAGSGGAAGFREPHADNSIPDFGAEAPASERARATAALAAFLNARAGGEWAKACPYLTRVTRAQLERFGGAAKGASKGCAAALAALSGGGSRGASPTSAETLTGSVAALRVKGNSAFALYRGPSGNKYVMPMVSEGGAWKVSQLAPLSYPIGATGAAP